MITLFNTPTAEVNKMTRFEHMVVIRDSIQELCDKGEDGPSYSGKVTIPAEVTHDDTTYPVIRINAYHIHLRPYLLTTYHEVANEVSGIVVGNHRAFFATYTATQGRSL